MSPAAAAAGGPSSRWAGIKTAARIMGPAALVSVAYMDPGNWAVSIEAGSRFGYQLVWVVVLSNLIAIQLQTLAARLGLVTGKSLAQVRVCVCVSRCCWQGAVLGCCCGLQALRDPYTHTPNPRAHLCVLRAHVHPAPRFVASPTPALCVSCCGC